MKVQSHDYSMFSTSKQSPPSGLRPSPTER